MSAGKMHVYPIMLRVAGRRVVVVGGGQVALRKARSLQKAGASVTVVAGDTGGDAAPPGFEGVELVRERYTPAFLADSALVFACTNDRALNARIAADARKAGALVNCADQPADCDFFVPAIASQGPVVVAVGTSGAAPSLAGRLKNDIADSLPVRIGEFAELLSQLREKVKASVADPRRRSDIMKRLTDESSYQVFVRDGEEAVVKMLDELIQ